MITDDHVHFRIRVEVGLDIELEVVGQNLLPLVLAADKEDVAGHRELRVEHGLHAGSGYELRGGVHLLRRRVLGRLGVGRLSQVLELRLAALCLLLNLHLLQLFLYEQQAAGQLVDLALQLLDCG